MVIRFIVLAFVLVGSLVLVDAQSQPARTREEVVQAITEQVEARRVPVRDTAVNPLYALQDRVDALEVQVAKLQQQVSALSAAGETETPGRQR